MPSIQFVAYVFVAVVTYLLIQFDRRRPRPNNAHGDASVMMPCKDRDDNEEAEEASASIVDRHIRHLKSNGFSIASLIAEQDQAKRDDEGLLCFAKAKADLLQRMAAENEIPRSIKAGNSFNLDDIECHLETKDLWEKFHELGTEMIITKTGR